MDLHGIALCDYIEAEGKVNRSRHLSGHQWDVMATSLKRGKSDTEIMTRLKRPDLDMAWFREMDRLIGEDLAKFFN